MYYSIVYHSIGLLQATTLYVSELALLNRDDISYDCKEMSFNGNDVSFNYKEKSFNCKECYRRSYIMIHPAAVRWCGMVLHQAFRARGVRKDVIGGEVRHGVPSGVSCETSKT